MEDIVCWKIEFLPTSTQQFDKILSHVQVDDFSTQKNRA